MCSVRTMRKFRRPIDYSGIDFVGTCMHTHIYYAVMTIIWRAGYKACKSGLLLVTACRPRSDSSTISEPNRSNFSHLRTTRQAARTRPIGGRLFRWDYRRRGRAWHANRHLSVNDLLHITSLRGDGSCGGIISRDRRASIILSVYYKMCWK